MFQSTASRKTKSNKTKKALASWRRLLQEQNFQNKKTTRETRKFKTKNENKNQSKSKAKGV
ncbi:hypothetical protein D9M68_970550 [compost metagenome]